MNRSALESCRELVKYIVSITVIHSSGFQTQLPTSPRGNLSQTKAVMDLKEPTSSLHTCGYPENAEPMQGMLPSPDVKKLGRHCRDPQIEGQFLGGFTNQWGTFYMSLSSTAG